MMHHIVIAVNVNADNMSFVVGALQTLKVVRV